MASLLGLDGVLRVIGTGYWLLMLVLVFLAMYKSKTWSARLVLTSLVLVLFIGPIAPSVYRGMVYHEKLAKAQALFDERCKTAGEKIYKTVDNVEGIVLRDVRGKRYEYRNTIDANWPYAGFPDESSGLSYVMEFVYYHVPRVGNSRSELLPYSDQRGGLRGYRYVDVDGPDGRYRYTLRDAPERLPGDPAEAYAVRVATNGKSPPYVVSYENIPDPEGRANWIAGGHVKVIDTRTGELLAEFIRYSFEHGFGNSNGERSAWDFAEQCQKSAYEGGRGHIRYFVEQVLKPAQER